MSTKGQQTRQRIIRVASELINTNGVKGMSLDDLLAGCELTKGGLYRHFSSKDEIVAEVVDQYISDLTERVGIQVSGASDSLGQLNAIIDSLASIASDPIVKGGCLLMSVSIAADQAPTRAQTAIRQAFQRLSSLIEASVRQAKADRAIAPDVKPKQFATVAISAIEGAILRSDFEGDPRHADYAAAFLKQSLRPKREV